MSVNLDNLKIYHQYDQNEKYEQLNKFSRHFEKGNADALAVSLPQNPQDYTDFTIITNGQDLHLAAFCKSLTPFFLKVPFLISTSVRLPNYASQKSFLFSLFTDQSSTELKSTQLEADAKKLNLLTIDYQSPAHTFGFLLGIFSRFNPTFAKQINFDKLFKIAEDTQNKLQKDLNTKNNPAKVLASKHSQKAVLYVSGGHLTGVAEYLSGLTIRQSKTFSNSYVFPEFKYFVENNFTYPTKVLAEYQILLLNSDLYPNNTKTEIQDFKLLLSQKRINFTEIKPDSQDWFEQIIESVVFLSYFSYYLSITNKVTI